MVDSPEQAVRILQLALVTLRALAAGDLVEAQRHVPVELTGYLVEPDSRHGPPDDAGMVEVGYSIDTAERRRGYARAALRWMLARAAAEPDVRVVRASVSPANAVSRQLVLTHGFVEVGDPWDEEDGLEIVYEVRAAGPAG